MNRFEVLFFTNENGKSDVAEFILSLSEVAQAKIYNQIDHLKEYGLTRHNPSIRKIVGTQLWEIRILGKNNLRLICITLKHKVVILHVFDKKSQKTSKKEIQIAIRRYNEIVDF